MGSGARMMLTQTGFVISIALSIGLVASVVDPKVMLAIFSGTQIGVERHRHGAVHRRPSTSPSASASSPACSARSSRRRAAAQQEFEDEVTGPGGRGAPA